MPARIWVLTICHILVTVSMLSPLLFPTPFTTTVVASSSSSLSPPSEDSKDIIAQLFNNKYRNGEGDSQKNPFESIWRTFKDMLDSKARNVMPSSLSSTSGDSSKKEHDATIHSQKQMVDKLLNRRGLLVERSLNQHYTDQLFEYLPEMKEFTLMEEKQRGMSDGELQIEARLDHISPTEFGILRWRQPDIFAGGALCHCYSESLNSYWSFQWCPQTQTIYQGRRQNNGLLHLKYNLGSKLVLPNVDKADDSETMRKSRIHSQRLLQNAKTKHPYATNIHTYVDGDICVEGRSLRRTSVLVFHENSSIKCREREGREMIIESIVEVRVCQYMVHICMDHLNDSKFDSSEHNDYGEEEYTSLVENESLVITESHAKEINQTLYYIKDKIIGPFVRKSDAELKSKETLLASLHSALPPLPRSRIQANLKLVKDMFSHAYDNYMYHGFPASEVKPITCAPASFNLVKIPGLTLIDSLDTLVVMGNYTEFARAVERLRFLNDNVYEETGIFTTGGGLFDINHNVSVFETNIRVLGGLLSAHQMASAFLNGKVYGKEVWSEDKSILIGRIDRNLETEGCDDKEIVSGSLSNDCDTTSTTLQCIQESSPEAQCVNQTNSYWVYDGFLLELAQDIGNRLLPAFDTLTGIPYGTVNLMSGIPEGETPIASLAGGGTLSLEMELLSRLTGKNEYGNAAKLATRALWMRRSDLNILGKHICTKRGQWTETLSGIGSNSDSFYEYLIKHHILFPEDSDFWLQLVAAYRGIYNESRVGEWYGDVDMYRGRSQEGAPRQVLEALMAFYPGMQVLLGEVTPAARTLNSFFLVREYLGFLPERFQFGHWKVDHGGGNHLLRPELLESAYFLHRSSKGFQNQFRSRKNNGVTFDSSGWVWSGDFALHSIERLTRTECGYGSLRDVSSETSGDLNAERNQVRLLDEMPSYFLSETLKYLYLLFDDKNILHTDDEHDWVFTTEAHPIHYDENETSGTTKLKQQTEQLKSRIQRRLDRKKQPSNDLRNRLLKEKWTESSKMRDFIQQLELLKENDNKIYKNRRRLESSISHDADPFSTAIQRLFPNDNSWSPFDVFNERLTSMNPTFLIFRKLGNELDLTKSCPNFYASNYLWIRALNGGISDYSDAYRSRMSDEFLVSERDIIQLGSIDALALHGAGVHIKSFYNTFFQHTFREKKSKEKKASGALKNGERQGKLSNGATRFDMGHGMGIFDVSAFPGGSGFFVQHVESGEAITTTLIADDFAIDNHGPLVLVDSKTEEGKKRTDLSHENPRTVVLADIRGSSYSCEVHIIESEVALQEGTTCNTDTSQDFKEDLNTKSTTSKIEDEIVRRFPCSPALFGPTHISLLEKTNFVGVEGKIRPSGDGDKNGCGRFSMKMVANGDDNMAETSESTSIYFNDGVEINSLLDSIASSDKVISIVQRGECTFQEKSYNKKLTERAKGVIVINNNEGDGLFVMSGGGSEELADLEDEKYPVTVLVTWDDGQKILEMLNMYGESQDKQLTARISLTADVQTSDTKLLSQTKSKFWPRVKASSDSIEIFSRSGWGIHAVQTAVDNEMEDPQWQLYLLKHDMLEDDDVP
eukprot:CAMPEP_0197193814 /NCGR_PEP_ID=MMETSP1423-20130617/28030_1 /TAXON_ID=476441 /ORGANISM="Pseudo-nitzschia heimii, Strain UNC1101" /LENGTH=1580 /DNA_ID=CAMNT_0042647111 /DNA_START=174 /DNA_END=4916 /DNA_ORIENTATION=-